MSDNILEVLNLRAEFPSREGALHVLNGVSFHVRRGELLGLVGETGSGKSLTLRAIIDLIPAPGRVTDGQISFKNEDLRARSDEAMRTIRGRQIAVVVQNARGALNPFLTLGTQIANVYRAHARVSRRDAEARVVELLRAVQLPDPERRVHAYPHELSGGMAQRALIAMALVCEPPLLLADEPTTGLDVTVQAQILSLLRDLVKQREASTILVTHDLGVVARYCDRIAVMFGGQIVEVGQVGAVMAEPQHPYTISLLRSMGRGPASITGDWPSPVPPDLLRPPSGCLFYQRCPLAMDKCRDLEPAPQAVSADHQAKCHLVMSSYATAH